MNKYRLLLVLLLIIPGIAGESQKIINKTIDWNPGQDVEINLNIIDSIKIIAWDQNRVEARLSVNINNNKHNDWYDLETKTSSRTVSMESLFLKNKISVNHSSNIEIYGKIYVPKECCLSVNTINGNTEIRGHRGTLSVKTISGFIDVSLSSECSANLTISSISGKVYTDLDLDTKDQKTSVVGTNIKAKTNDGKTPIKLETISGNIYLREDT